MVQSLALNLSNRTFIDFQYERNSFFQKKYSKFKTLSLLWTAFLIFNICFGSKINLLIEIFVFLFVFSLLFSFCLFSFSFFTLLRVYNDGIETAKFVFVLRRLNLTVENVFCMVNKSTVESVVDCARLADGRTW